jgi:hypothetical protein
MSTFNRWAIRTTCNHGHPLATFANTRRLKRWSKTQQRYVTATCIYCKACDHARRPKKSRGGKGWKRQLAACPKGHRYEGTNLGVVDKTEKGKTVERRYCVACTRARWRRNVAAYSERVKARRAA